MHTVGGRSTVAVSMGVISYGVIELLKRYNIEIAGKNAVVVGRSNIVVCGEEEYELVRKML